jgi:ABC-type Fe3+ transport system permease subunit
MSNEPFDAPDEKTSKIPGWVWGVGGAVVVGLLAIVVVIPLVAIVIIAFLTILGTSLNEKFETVGSTVQPAGGGSALHLFIDQEPGR